MAIVVTHSSFSAGAPIPFNEFVNTGIRIQNHQLLTADPLYTTSKLVIYYKTHRQMEVAPLNNCVEVFSYRAAPYNYILNSLYEASIGEMNEVVKEGMKKIGVDSPGYKYEDHSRKVLTFNGIASVIDVINSPSDKDALVIRRHTEMLVERLLPDYYIKISEAWIPNFRDSTLEKQLNDKFGPHGEKQKFGDIGKLPSSDRIEVLSFIARTLDNSSPKIGKMYEIIRERRNDESSKVLELKELDHMELGAKSMVLPTRNVNNNTWVDGDGR